MDLLDSRFVKESPTFLLLNLKFTHPQTSKVTAPTKLSGAIGVPEKLVLFSIGEVCYVGFRKRPVVWSLDGCCLPWTGVGKMAVFNVAGVHLGKISAKGKRLVETSFCLVSGMQKINYSYKVGPEPIIINGVMGHL